jgi:hypothetical protein
MRIIEELVERIRDSGDKYNPEVQDKPYCILWTDGRRDWEKYIPILKSEIPELLILGDYDPQNQTGPAIWIRYVVTNKDPNVKISSGQKPIIYLPGVSRQELRAVESCTDEVKLIAELQYRGVFWSQANTRDWTLFAFLSSEHGGLGLDVFQDGETRKSIDRAFEKLLHRELISLKGRTLDIEFFDNLLTPDYIKNLLEWINNESVKKESLNDNEWKSFVSISKGKLGFNPEKDGVLTGAALIANHKDLWAAVWERFCEAPERYENIPLIIRKCIPPSSMNWANPGHNEFEGWPQWNEMQENNLRIQLLDILNYDIQKAKQKIIELEKEHAHRRGFVWSRMGESPLAIATEQLHVLSITTETALKNGNITDLETGYVEGGWRADYSKINALASVTKQNDVEAVSSVIQTIYKPWAEDSARYLQRIVDEEKNDDKFRYPQSGKEYRELESYDEGDCILFIDGLRFDLGKRLAELLVEKCDIQEEVNWAALPSVTATAKPAVSPVHHKIYGDKINNAFIPNISGTEKSVSSYNFKKLLTDSGWTIINPFSITSAATFGWCEFGDIDKIGHDRGWKLVYEIEKHLKDIRDLVVKLLESGWKRIHIVTDHGWLLMPGGLPKTELAKVLTETKWGRCAALKPGVKSDQRQVSWYWNSVYHIAVADGISCFRNGIEYDHGGISLQECLTLKMTVSPGSSIELKTINFREIVWRGQRCIIALDGSYNGLSIDIRMKPADPGSSIVFKHNQVREDGTASVVVENEDLHGQEAYIILINQENKLVSQNKTRVGVN